MKTQTGSAADLLHPQPVGRHLSRQGYWRAGHGRLEAATEFAKTIKRHREGILNDVRSRNTNGVLKGLNSLFKATSAKARGFRTIRNAIAAYCLVACRLELGLPELGCLTHTK
jgi:transposase